MAEKVLLVDDEEAFLSIMSERMKNRGMTVLTTASATEAISIVEAESFDVIVLDLQMPGMDGLEAINTLKSKQPELQIILLTGHVTLERGIEAMKLGAADLMEKPADINILEYKIRKAHATNRILAQKRTEEKIKEIIENKGW